MRHTFVKCLSLKTAKRHCPWATYFHKVHLGYQCFESYDDYKTFLKQI
jgi:hypothetical protein